MIYLIDDSKLQAFDAEYVFDIKYKHILTVVQTNQQFESLFPKMVAASCILVHRTFCSSGIAKEKCMTISNDGKKFPVVVFSAGDSETAVYEEEAHIIDALKKSVFYIRLKYFLDSYLVDGKVNLKILAYGRDFAKVEVRNLTKSIFATLQGCDNILTVEYLAKISVPLKKIVTLASPKMGIDFEELIENLEDSPIPVANFKNNINNIVISFEQYGKNIYTWK